MKTKLRKITALLVSALLTLVAGCTAAQEEGSPGSTVVSQSQSQDSRESAAAPESIYPDPTNPVQLSFFADCTWLDYDNLDGIVAREVERLTGVSFDFTKATDSEQLILLMASNDLPDLVMASSNSKLSRLSSQEFCYSYNELIESYAPDWVIPEVEKNLNAYYAEDGNFYMLKNEFNTIEEIQSFDAIGPNFGQLHLRKDIYEDIGSPDVTDRDSFFAMLATVKETHPDMSPVVFNPREYSGFAQFVGYDPVMPTDENGNFCYAFSDPKYRDYMKLFHDMYKEGFITAENFTLGTDEQVFQGTTTGKTFLLSHYAGNDDQMFTSNVQTTMPEASFIQLPLTDGWKHTIGVSGWAGCFISKNCDNPETAIKFIRWAKEPNNQITTMIGEESVDWEANADGTFTTLERYNTAFSEGKYDSEYKQIGFLVSGTDFIRESIKFYTVATPETKGIFKDAVKKANWSNVINLCYPKADTDESVIYSNLNSLLEEYFAKLGTAASDEAFDAIYSEMMSEADKIGITALDDYLASTYNKLCAQMGTK